MPEYVMRQLLAYLVLLPPAPSLHKLNLLGK